jgi:hypothetical protein
LYLNRETKRAPSTIKIGTQIAEANEKKESNMAHGTMTSKHRDPSEKRG